MTEPPGIVGMAKDMAGVFRKHTRAVIDGDGDELADHMMGIAAVGAALAAAVRRKEGLSLALLGVAMKHFQSKPDPEDPPPAKAKPKAVR